jgi:hypothetical protein
MQVTQIHNFNYEGEENYVLIRVENNCINVIKKTRYGPSFLSNHTCMQYHSQNSIYDGKKRRGWRYFSPVAFCIPVVGFNSRFPARCPLLLKSNILLIGPALISNDWFPIRPKPQLSSMNRRIDD